MPLDLNIDTASRTGTAVPAAESIDASMSARFLAVDAPSSADDVPPVRGALCRRAQGQELLASRPVPEHGFRADASLSTMLSLAVDFGPVLKLVGVEFSVKI
jgi:hypothetical protein